MERRRGCLEVILSPSVDVFDVLYPRETFLCEYLWVSVMSSVFVRGFSLNFGDRKFRCRL